MTNAEALVVILNDGRWWKIDRLAEFTRWSRRDVEAAIEEARLGGFPIIGSSLRGVKLSNDPAEVREYARSRRMRTLSVSRGTRALLHAANRMEGRAARQAELGL